MYAIVETSGRQFKVSKGDTVEVDRVDAKPGTKITLDRVLMLGGDSVTLGAPTVDGASVKIKVVEHYLGEKRLTRKYSRRQRTRRKVGFRPSMTRIEILSIDTEG